ncbi:MAG: hypothetical protein PHD67_10395, partial [Oscillospiraceae bacterium]|nr:hypothetical protein [Oscillospiraceae bacterium]
MDAALKRFATEHGMRMTRSCAYGEIEGFLISLSGDSAARGVYINYMAGTDTLEENGRRGRLDAFLAGNMAQGNLLQYRVMSDGVAIGVRLNGRGMANLRMLLPQILTVLAQEGFTGTMRCSRCGGEINGTEKI